MKPADQPAPAEATTAAAPSRPPAAARPDFSATGGPASTELGVALGQAPENSDGQAGNRSASRDGLPAYTLTIGAGVLLLLAVWSTLAGMALYDREQLLENLRDRNALMARVFADRAARSLDATGLALATLGEQLARGTPPEAPEMRSALSQTLVSLPFLRAAAVLDARGTVLASTDANDRGRTIPLEALGGRPSAGREQLGRFVSARQLADLAPGSKASAPEGVGFVPLARAVNSSSGPLIAVALVNFGSFANFQRATIDDQRSASALLTYGGQLVAATAEVPRALGSDLRSLAPYTHFLPRLEHGQWTGESLRAGRQLAAFHVSATQPLLAVVEVAEGDVMAQWHHNNRRLWLAAATALLLIGTMTAVAARSVRTRQLARAALDEAQGRIARRERELRITIASVQELIFRTNALGEVTFVNARWTDYSDLPAEAALGLKPWELVVPACREAAYALFDPSPETGARRMQAAVAQRGGGVRWYDVAVMPLFEQGRLVGFAGSAADVSELHNAERVAREARRVAEEASHAKTEFIANISHELRTPLQTIIGFSELGLMRGREQPRLHAMFDDIHRAGERMLKLVNDLLDVSKIESTVGTMNLERADLRDLVRDVVHQLQPLTDQRRLSVHVDLPEAPLRAKVDPPRIEQVLRNVLANASRFAPEGSRIDVRGRLTDRGELHVAVADRGPGIPEAELESIFEAFVQSSTTKDGSGGTGLGLAICRKILEAHGGRILATNRPQGGAVFHIVLPARGVSETAPMPLL